MQNRMKTEQEKEFERLPFCLYDPLPGRCESVEFPPTIDHCNRCITIGLADELAQGNNSEVMRWFIAYRTFKSQDGNGVSERAQSRISQNCRNDETPITALLNPKESEGGK